MGDFHVACFAGVCGQMGLKLSEAVYLPLSSTWLEQFEGLCRLIFLCNICIKGWSLVAQASITAIEARNDIGLPLERLKCQGGKGARFG